MENVLIRLNPELKAAVEKIRKRANSRFHVIAAESGAELKKIGVGELNSVKLGIYSANGLEIGHALISDWVSKSGLPGNIKYLNGVLFLDVEHNEIETESDDEWTADEDDDEFGIWDGLSNEEIERGETNGLGFDLNENENDENETE
jgi:hypothetical protein